jgi:hypothetical protein
MGGKRRRRLPIYTTAYAALLLDSTCTPLDLIARRGFYPTRPPKLGANAHPNYSVQHLQTQSASPPAATTAVPPAFAFDLLHPASRCTPSRPRRDSLAWCCCLCCVCCIPTVHVLSRTVARPWIQQMPCQSLLHRIYFVQARYLIAGPT